MLQKLRRNELDVPELNSRDNSPYDDKQGKQAHKFYNPWRKATRQVLEALRKDPLFVNDENMAILWKNANESYVPVLVMMMSHLVDFYEPVAPPDASLEDIAVACKDKKHGLETLVFCLCGGAAVLHYSNGKIDKKKMIELGNKTIKNMKKAMAMAHCLGSSRSMLTNMEVLPGKREMTRLLAELATTLPTLDGFSRGSREARKLVRILIKVTSMLSTLRLRLGTRGAIAAELLALCEQIMYAIESRAGFIGPTMSGKSTLFGIVILLMKPLFEVMESPGQANLEDFARVFGEDNAAEMMQVIEDAKAQSTAKLHQVLKKLHQTLDVVRTYIMMTRRRHLYHASPLALRGGRR